mmetsp:Transcript_25755/g.66626  ORF Transcript_25755/g.66626 Transcript_25755/m.66626 type:complete len:98 (-) Transcript_25755:131-424(-)
MGTLLAYSCQMQACVGSPGTVACRTAQHATVISHGGLATSRGVVHALPEHYRQAPHPSVRLGRADLACGARRGRGARRLWPVQFVHQGDQALCVTGC